MEDICEPTDDVFPSTITAKTNCFNNSLPSELICSKLKFLLQSLRSKLEGLPNDISQIGVYDTLSELPQSTLIDYYLLVARCNVISRLSQAMEFITYSIDPYSQSRNHWSRDGFPLDRCPEVDVPYNSFTLIPLYQTSLDVSMFVQLQPSWIEFLCGEAQMLYSHTNLFTTAIDSIHSMMKHTSCSVKLTILSLVHRTCLTIFEGTTCMAEFIEQHSKLPNASFTEREASKLPSQGLPTASLPKVPHTESQHISLQRKLFQPSPDAPLNASVEILGSTKALPPCPDSSPFVPTTAIWEGTPLPSNLSSGILHVSLQSGSLVRINYPPIYPQLRGAGALSRSPERIYSPWTNSSTPQHTPHRLRSFSKGERRTSSNMLQFSSNTENSSSPTTDSEVTRTLIRDSRGVREDVTTTTNDQKCKKLMVSRNPRKSGYKEFTGCNGSPVIQLLPSSVQKSHAKRRIQPTIVSTEVRKKDSIVYPKSSGNGISHGRRGEKSGISTLEYESRASESSSVSSVNAFDLKQREHSSQNAEDLKRYFTGEWPCEDSKEGDLTETLSSSDEVDEEDDGALTSSNDEELSETHNLEKDSNAEDDVSWIDFQTKDIDIVRWTDQSTRVKRNGNDKSDHRDRTVRKGI